MPNSPRKNCPTLTIAIYHLKPWTWVLTQFWTFEIISINKKVTAFQTKVVFSFFDISSKLPGWILGTLRGPKKKIFFFVDLYGNELQHTKFWAKSVTMLSKKCNTWHETTLIKVYIFSNNNLLNCHVAKFKFKNTQVSLSCLEWYRYKLLYMIETC